MVHPGYKRFIHSKSLRLLAMQAKVARPDLD